MKTLSKVFEWLGIGAFWLVMGVLYAFCGALGLAYLLYILSGFVTFWNF